MYDYLIVGAGLFGSTFAQIMAEKGQNVLVIDKRDHIAGNCHTPEISGIKVHKYGPHIFNTNSLMLWDYVGRFSEFNNYVNRTKAKYGNTLYSLPINLMTLQQVWGVNTPKEALKKINECIVANDNPKNFEEAALASIGKELYEMFFYGYTKKQWGVEPTEVPANIFSRLPIRLTFDDNYFDKRYQGIPVDGYTRMVENMLDSPRISIKTKCEFTKDMTFLAKKTLYTGSLDTYFDNKFGPLQYRSLRFEWIYGSGDIQGNAIVNYPEQQIPFTRQIEHKHFYKKENFLTVISREFSQRWEPGTERYYPINNQENDAVYLKYKNLADQEPNLLFGGRLASYRYWNMDQTIGAAMSLASRESV